MEQEADGGTRETRVHSSDGEIGALSGRGTRWPGITDVKSASEAPLWPEGVGFESFVEEYVQEGALVGDGMVEIP